MVLVVDRWMDIRCKIERQKKNKEEQEREEVEVGMVYL